MTRTTRFVQNTLCTAAYMLMAMVMGFVTPRLMILYYGSGVNGLIVSVTEFLSYFRLIEAGVPSVVAVALYRPLAQGDQAAVASIASATRRFYWRAGLLLALITVIFSAVYPMLVPVVSADGLLMSRFSVMLLVLALGASYSLEFLSMGCYRVLLTADQRTFATSLASMLSLLVSTAVLVILPALGLNVILVRLAASLTVLLRAGFVVLYVRRHDARLSLRAKPNLNVLHKRWDALYMELTVLLEQSMGVILATLVTRDAAMLSVYGVYHMITIGLWGVLKTCTTGLSSLFGNLLVSRDKAAFRQAYDDFECLYHMVVSVLFGVAAVLIVPFVSLYTRGVEDVNYSAPLLGLALIAEGLTIHAKTPLDLMIYASGAFRRVRGHCLLQTAVSVCAGTALGLLGLRRGVELSLCGIVLGVSAGNLARIVCQLRFVPTSITGLSWRRSAGRIVRLILTVTLIAAPCLLWLPAPVSFAAWLLCAVLLTLYAAAVTLVLNALWDRAALRSLLARLRTLRRQKQA